MYATTVMLVIRIRIDPCAQDGAQRGKDTTVGTFRINSYDN